MGQKDRGLWERDWTNRGQKEAEGQRERTSVPWALEWNIKLNTLDKRTTGVTTQQFSPCQTWKNASTPEETRVPKPREKSSNFIVVKRGKTVDGMGTPTAIQ